MLKNDLIVHVSLKIMNFYSFQFIARLAYILSHLQKFVFSIPVLVLAIVFLFIFIHNQVSLLNDVRITVSFKSGGILFFLTLFKYRIYHAQVIRYSNHPTFIILSLVFQLILIAIEF
jgi:hypothetical protein